MHPCCLVLDHFDQISLVWYPFIQNLTNLSMHAAVRQNLIFLTTATTVTLVSLPSLLFFGGSKRIVPGSVLRLYCQVKFITSNLTVTWTRDGAPLVKDLPHIDIFFSHDRCTSNDSVTLALVVDTFHNSDSGMYQCTAEDGIHRAIGRALTLTGTANRQQI